MGLHQFRPREIPTHHSTHEREPGDKAPCRAQTIPRVQRSRRIGRIWQFPWPCVRASGKFAWHTKGSTRDPRFSRVPSRAGLEEFSKLSGVAHFPSSGTPATLRELFSSLFSCIRSSSRQQAAESKWLVQDYSYRLPFLPLRLRPFRRQHRQRGTQSDLSPLYSDSS